MYEAPSPLASYHRAFVWGIFVLALLVRAAYLKQLRDSPLWDDLPVDLGYYRDWAIRIAAGDWVGSEVFEQSPLYAYFQAVVIKIFGTGLLVPRLIQAVVGSVTCVLIYRVGRLVFSPAAGLMSGLMAAVYGPFLFYDGMLMKEVFAVFFMTVVIHQLHAGNASQRGLLATGGLGLALAALVRDNMILVSAPVALWLMIDPWLRGDAMHGGAIRSGRLWALLKEGLSRVGAFASGILLVIVPVAVRNYHVSGDVVILTAGGGEVFYIGNNPEADGRYSPPPFVRAASTVEHEDFRAEAARRLGHPVTRREASSFWLRQGLDWIHAHPGEWLALLGRKLIIFWNYYELPDNHSYEHHRRLLPILQLPLLTFAWLTPAAVMGLVLTSRGWRDLMGLYLIGCGYLASVMLFFNFGRFRMPMVPVLLLFAGAGLTRLAVDLVQRRWVAPAVALGAAVMVAGVASMDLEDDPLHLGQSHAQLAELLLRAGRVEEADVESDESLRRLEGFFREMGGATDADGHGVPAAPGPGRPDLGASFYGVMSEAYETRSRISRAMGREAEADAWARRSIAAEGRQPDAADLALRGRSEMEAGRFEDAALLFEQALARLSVAGSPNERLARARLVLQLAEALHRSGRAREALAKVEAVLRLDTDLPRVDRAGAHYGAALIYRDLGDGDRMRHHLRECLELDPNHPRAEWMREMIAEGP